jgi:hypothetical protein
MDPTTQFLIDLLCWINTNPAVPAKWYNFNADAVGAYKAGYLAAQIAVSEMASKNV